MNACYLFPTNFYLTLKECTLMLSRNRYSSHGVLYVSEPLVAFVTCIVWIAMV